MDSSFFTARLRKLFTGKEFEVDCDKVCFAGRDRSNEGFAGEDGPDGLRGVACDLSEDLMEDFGANLIKRSLSVIRGNTFGADTLNKDAEVRDLRGA